MPEKPTYVIDGANFSDFAGFIEECNRGFIRETSSGNECRGNLDAFNDYLHWGPYNDGRWTPTLIIWRNSAKSRVDLGYSATASWLEENSRRCHHLNVPSVLRRLEESRLQQGPTLFDWLVEIVTKPTHIELRLE
ncbi:hypothetical protein R5W24_004239 [Gemmata sp. JC717]|uniref:hypothetical protein n=1 Tax=Gemmata algarum TaxID=2975278 RepID=UPI0021BAC917|nr:hypothetical protein [Gemmata algarum]MDY3555104.1 hypothetical protein [Gemmata algarum]